jgi:hypothetical protein
MDVDDILFPFCPPALDNRKHDFDFIGNMKKSRLTSRLKRE